MKRHLNAILLPAAVALLIAGCTERPATSGQAPATPSAPATADAPASPTSAAPGFAPVDDATTLLALPTSGTCSLENLVNMGDGTPSPGAEPNSYAADRANTYTLIGFATDSDAGTVPASIRVLLHGASGAYAMPGTMGLDREDVAKFFNKPALAKSGYQVVASFAGLSPGAYEVHVIKGADDAAQLCPTHQTIVIR